MTTSLAGRALIESFEGLRLTAYQDIRGIWTIGYGHVGRDVPPGLTITQAQADELLEADLQGAERAVNTFVKVPLTQNQFDALVSFTYNVGAGNLEHSTLLSLLNQGAYVGASAQFLAWDRAGGVISSGLTRRRLAERDLFNTPEAS